MPESDLIELLLLSQGETAQTVMNLTAIVFAYVLMAYFVGAQLTRIWALAISFCYSLFVTPIFVGCVKGVQITNSLASTYVSNFPNGSLVDEYAIYVESPLLVGLLILTPVAVGWLGSLLYMHTFIRSGGSG